MEQETAINANQVMLGLLYLAGFISHYIQKCAKEKIGYLEYWIKNPMYSGLSVVGSIGGFTGLMATGNVDMATYFMAGFMADSLFNKVGRDVLPEQLPTQTTNTYPPNQQPYNNDPNQSDQNRY